jgi:hypothetical protein
MHGMTPSIFTAQLDESPDWKWILFFEKSRCYLRSKSLHRDSCEHFQKDALEIIVCCNVFFYRFFPFLANHLESFA